MFLAGDLFVFAVTCRGWIEHEDLFDINPVT
jgi:hypothetical protein